MAITNEDIVALAACFLQPRHHGQEVDGRPRRLSFSPSSGIAYLLLCTAATSPCRPTTTFTKKLADQVHWDGWESCTSPPLKSTNPERARAQGIVYWEGRRVDSAGRCAAKCYVGEDWIVQRVPWASWSSSLYINAFHRFLSDAAPIELR